MACVLARTATKSCCPSTWLCLADIIVLLLCILTTWCPQVIGGAAPAALAAPTNGLALMGLIYAFGATSGAHLSECSPVGGGRLKCEMAACGLSRRICCVMRKQDRGIAHHRWGGGCLLGGRGGACAAQAPWLGVPATSNKQEPDPSCCCSCAAFACPCRPCCVLHVAAAWQDQRCQGHRLYGCTGGWSCAGSLHLHHYHPWSAGRRRTGCTR